MSIISSLGVVSRNELQRIADDCPICFDPLNNSTRVVYHTEQTSHLFHEACLFRSLRNNPSCPLCREGIPIEHNPDYQRALVEFSSRRFFNVTQADLSMAINNLEAISFELSEMLTNEVSLRDNPSVPSGVGNTVLTQIEQARALSAQYSQEKRSWNIFLTNRFLLTLQVVIHIMSRIWASFRTIIDHEQQRIPPMPASLLPASLLAQRDRELAQSPLSELAAGRMEIAIAFPQPRLQNLQVNTIFTIIPTPNFRNFGTSYVGTYSSNGTMVPPILIYPPILTIECPMGRAVRLEAGWFVRQDNFVVDGHVRFSFEYLSQYNGRIEMLRSEYLLGSNNVDLLLENPEMTFCVTNIRIPFDRRQEAAHEFIIANHVVFMSFEEATSSIPDFSESVSSLFDRM